MKTIQSELKAKGLAKEAEKAPVEEFVQGEIEFSRSSGVVEIGKSLYGKPIVQRPHKHRHGRAVIMEVKKEMERRKVDRNSLSYRLADALILEKGKWQDTRNFMILSDARILGSVSATLSRYYEHGFLERKGEVGIKGFLHKLREDIFPRISAEELYFKFLDAEKERRAGHPKSAKKKPPVVEKVSGTLDLKSLKQVLQSIPDRVRVEVSGKVDINIVIGGVGYGKKKKL